jgi:hypothetical protein
MCQFSAMHPSADTINVGGDKIDRLALALDLPEAPRKVPAETQMCDDTISGHDHLFNFAAGVRIASRISLEAASGPAIPWGRPAGNVFSAKFGASNGARLLDH